MPPAHAVPARPRPDRPLEELPAAQAQDPGLHRPRGRPLPHPAHAHDRGLRHLAHGRAGAAPERGPDRGDRPRPRPRPPAVRARRRGGARPRAARALRAPLPPQRALAAGRRRARARRPRPQPDRAGARRHPAPHRARSCPRTLEGRIVRLVDRIAYINHDIDDALRAGVLAEGDLPREEIAILGETGSERIDLLVHDLVEHSERAGDIVQGEEVGGAMARLRKFMFEHVYFGERRAARAGARDASVDPGAVRPLHRAPGRASRRSTGRRRRPGDPRDRLPRRHDRPLLHPRVRAARRAARVSYVSRVTAGVDRARPAAADIVEVVSGHTELRRRARATLGPVPVPRRAHAVVLGRPGREALLLLRLPGRRRRLHASCRRRRGSTSARRSSSSPTATASSSTYDSRRPATRTSGAARASGCSSCSSKTAALLRALPVGLGRGGRARDLPRAARPRARGARASSASASRRAPGTAC